MIKKVTKTNIDTSEQNFNKLSIQVSLNGLSFCVLDTITNTILNTENLVFEKEHTPQELKIRLKQFLSTHGIDNQKFSEVVVIHRNSIFSLVPRALFNEAELANYLKFNTKILANDHIVFDEMQNHEIINVYVPFSNVNNYIFDLYGEFEFQHNATIMVNSLLNIKSGVKGVICYANVGYRQMDIIIVSNKKLLLFNSFDFDSKEDFLYYLLFTIEQLKLDSQNLILKLFGSVEEGDEIYELCYRYVKDVSIFIPSKNNYPVFDFNEESIDFTLLSAF